MLRNRTLLMLIAVVMLGAFHADVWALGLGPGGGVRRGGGRGGNNGPKKDPKKEQEEKDRETHKRHVQQMPKLEKCASLDTSEFDRIDDQLELSKEQEKRIDNLKQRLKDRANELEKSADAASSNFRNAAEPACPQAGGALMAAIQACKSYIPNREFESGVSLILTESQRTKLKMLRSGKRPDVPAAKKNKADLANE